jgi:manganese/iron transport system ATP-binding protein
MSDILRQIGQEIRISGHRAIHKPGTPILEIRNLSLMYDNVAVLDGLNFFLTTGERIALVGPNGAGKSTLFKVISGVISPHKGEVSVYGQGPDGHICISYLPQRNQVDWRFPVSVADVVMMGRIGKMGLLRWPRRRDWEIVHQALEDVGLADLGKRQISELSGGQQQRMFIARALAQEAELMLMDEPFTGLDVNSEEMIYQILDELRSRQVTIFVSTHDLDKAAQRFDRVMLLNRRLLGIGKPDEVFTPERLLSAYGGHLHLVEGDGELVLVGDTCCDEGDG